jgi:hypothetical protein
MRLSVRIAALATAVVALTCGTQPLAAQSRPITGTYSATINSPQGAVKAVIILKRDNGAYGGTLAAEGFPEIPITSVTPSDSVVKLVADTPDGGVSVSIRFGAGDKVTGTVLYQGTEMAMDGTFAPSGAAAMGGSGAVTGVGEYAFKTTGPLLGMPEFAFTCSITKGANGVLGGSCGSEAGSASVSSVTVAGNAVTMNGDTPGGPMKLVVTISGAEAEGTITVGAELARVKGQYTSK